METKRHSFLVRVAMTLLLTVLTTVTAWADEWPEYITDVKLIGGTQTKVDELKSSYQSQGWTIINVNLNEGVANSDYIFLIYKKDNHVSTNGGYVTDLYLNATAGDHPSGYSTSSITYNGHTYSRCPYDGNSAFYTYRGHLNANAGGMEIHLYYTKENFSDKRALTSITCNYSSSGALYWWNNSNDYPANLNNGNNGSAIYMHINKTTKVNRPNPEPSMASSLVYTSKPLKLIASNYTNNNPGTLYYRVNSGDYTSTVNDVTATNAGTHTVYYYSGSDSYGNSSESYAHSKTVTIAKSPNSGATVTCGNYLEGSTPNPSLTGTNLSSGTVTFKYSMSQNGSYTTTKPSAAGTYWVKATIAGDDNCYEYTTAATSFNIIYNWRLHNSGDTEDDAYVISTQADLKYLAFWVNSGIDFAGKFFKLGDNIAFDKSKENNLTPIGTESHPFDGTFDGNKKTISGLNINKPDNDNVGLFGYATKEATIKNLTVDNSTITGGQLVGAILGCGDSKDVFSAKTTIENCLVTSSVTVSGQFCVGGIAGEKAIINGCVCAATVSGQQQVGGIIGSNSFDVTNCLYTGTNVSGTYHIGAISGEGNTSNHFHYNYYTADVTCGGGFGQNSTDIGQDDTGGRKAVTINAADGVTVTPTGTSTAYNVSGITAYAGNSCIGYDGHIYAGATETVSLDIAYDIEGFSLTGYTDGNGNTLTHVSDNTYTLTMTANASTVTPVGSDLWGVALSDCDGTAEHPYLITTPAGLDLLASKVNGGTNYNGKYFELGDDIEYDGTANNYTPIGTETNAFAGRFDGKGHTVSGINIVVSTQDYRGLFGKIGSAEVKNLTLDNSRIVGRIYCGGIAGYNYKSTISNCHVTSSVTIHASSPWADSHGGIVGHNDQSSIIGCTSSADVTASSNLSSAPYFGGIAGFTSGTIRDCLVYGGSINGSDKAGAVLGKNSGGTLTNNHYSGVTLNGSEALLNAGVGSGSQDGTRYICAIIPYEGVALTFPSLSATTEYPYNGLKIYPTGMSYKGQYYNYISNADAGISGDVTFTATYSGSVPEDYALGGFGYTSLADATDVSTEWAATDGSATCTLCTYIATPYYIAPTFRYAIWGDGDGSQGNPYIIYNTAGMDKLASDVNSGERYSGKYFELGADIEYDKAVENNYTPIGNGNNSFFGTFDGKGHTISGIRISDTGGTYKAIFGGVDGTIKNLVVNDSRIEAHQDIGGIVATLWGTIENCHVGSDVTLTGNSYVGGIAYKIEGGTIKGCTSAATIIGTEASGMNAQWLGGIAGYASRYAGAGANPTLTDNLFTGTISGDLLEYIGAIVGENNCDEPILTNNYHTCSGMGGVGGEGSVTGNDEDGAQLAYEFPTANGAMGNAGSTYGTGGYTGITAYEHGLAYNGKFYSPSPWGGSGTEEDPYIIYNTAGMDKLANDVNGGNDYQDTYFVLGNDIVYTPDVLTLDLDGDGNNDSNYMPVGNSASPFMGNFDGQGHTISGISVNANEMYYIGVFGINDGTVKNLTVSDCLFAGSMDVGAIAGLNRGTVENCHVAAYVSVTGNNIVGGIVGENDGTFNGGPVLGCTSAATLSAKEYAAYFGGIAGRNTGTLTDNLFTGTIGEIPDGSNNFSIGAITGYHYTDYSGMLTNNFHTCSGMGGVGNDNDATNTDQAGAQFAISSTMPPASIDPNVSEPTAVYSYTIGSTQYIGITAYEHGLYYNGKYYYWSEDIVVPGDANGDGQLDISDAVAIVNFILGKPLPAGFNDVAADMNGDGKVTISDAVAVVNMVASQQ